VRQTERSLRAFGNEVMAWRDVRQLSSTLDRVRPLSMVDDLGLIHLARVLRTVVRENVPGDVVECGVWRGGAAFMLADQLKRAAIRDRKVWLFDSFEGLPPAEAVDGASALAYSSNTESPGYFDNCRASFEEVQAKAKELGLTAHTELVKGWFSDTLPAVARRVGPIAILHIDSDWYSSVRACLDHLYEQVSEGGYVVLNDYFTWDGCAIAAHEFLSSRRLPDRIEAIPGIAACMRKRAPRLEGHS
jgi:O-methyltransferase